MSHLIHTSNLFLSLNNYIFTVSKEGVIQNSFSLKEVTLQDLRSYRELGIPSFVLKYNGRYFWTEIPHKLKVASQPIFGLPLTEHLCGSVCEHLAPGICPKVFSMKGIEFFPFITFGYETFNTKLDCFVVLECTHYQKQFNEAATPRRKIELRMSLADFMWPNDSNLTYQKVKNQTERNLAKLKEEKKS